MSKTIDERVVEMRFDNKQFESNVQTSLSTIEKLKKSLDMDGATKGLESIDSAAKKVDMSGLGSAVETVKTRFSALEIMAVTALANITKPSVIAARISSSSKATISASLLFNFSGRWPVKHTRRILSSDSFDIRITTFPKYSLLPERASFKYKYHHNLRYYFHPFALTASPNVVIEYILEVRWFCGHPSKADRIAGATRLVRLQNRQRGRLIAEHSIQHLPPWQHSEHGHIGSIVQGVRHYHGTVFCRGRND